MCIIGLAAGVLIALLTMPKTGYDCRICEEASCQNFLGWQCANSYNRDGYCQALVYPDSSVALVCPAGNTVRLPNGSNLTNVDAICSQRCGVQDSEAITSPVSSPAPPATLPPGGAGSPAAPTPPGTTA